MSHPSLDTLSDADIIHLCSASNPHRIILGAIVGGAAVVKILEDVAVKFGFGVKEDEWKNQGRAYELISRAVVRVPKPYRFFTSGANGYLVMEYIEGEVFRRANAVHVKRLREALFHLATIQSDNPGSLGGGPSRGPLWSPYHDFTPLNTHDIEEYYNRRIGRIGRKLDFEGLPLVLVHGDIVDRNIIVTDEGIALVDWKSAGFYPRVLERCAMHMNFSGSDSGLTVVDEVSGRLDKEEETQIHLLQFACSQYDRFIWCVWHSRISLLSLTRYSGVARLKPVKSPKLQKDALQVK